MSGFRTDQGHLLLLLLERELDPDAFALDFPELREELEALLDFLEELPRLTVGRLD
jgi:hypothetical protein